MGGCGGTGSHASVLMPTMPRNLDDLLRSLFSEDSLRVFLRRFDWGSRVLANAAGSSAPFSRLVADVVDELSRHHVVDVQFFTELLTDFPRQEHRIRQLAHSQGLMLPTPATSPTPNDDAATGVASKLFDPITAAAPRFAPAQFFTLQDRIRTSLSRMETIGHESGIESVRVVLAELKRRLNVTAYTVAVAGPQRVGKSMLVNALLGTDVSPVADYPTTAVPLLFVAGDVPVAEIRFADGTRTIKPASSDALREFAAHQGNEDNQKDVQVISVHLPNATLAKGMALIDTPGLRDASPAVREVTATALGRSDAVIYVLDASRGKKFTLDASIQDDLKTETGRRDRVLLALNQADELPLDQIQPLLTYVEKELRKYHVWDALACPPILVSGQMAFHCRQRGSALPDEFLALEHALWDHLLKHKQTGLHRLAEAATTLRGAVRECHTLLDDRSTRGVEATDTARARETWRAALDEISRLVRVWRQETSVVAFGSLRGRMSSLRQTLEAEIGGLAAAHLPSSTQLLNRIRLAVHAISRETLVEVDGRAEALGAAVAEITGRTLAESGALMGLHGRGGGIRAPFLVPMPEFSLAGLGPEMGLLGAFAAAFAGPVAAVAAGLIGLFLGEDLKRKRLERKRKGLRDGVRENAERAEEQLLMHFRELIHRRGEEIESGARVRLTTFIEDAERRLGKLGNPLSEEEAALLERLKSDLDHLDAELQAIGSELQPLLDQLA